MKKFYIIPLNDVSKIKLLYSNRINNQYIILNYYEEYSDIAQYSLKYDMVTIKTVKTSNLDTTKELVAYK